MIRNSQRQDLVTKGTNAEKGRVSWYFVGIYQNVGTTSGEITSDSGDEVFYCGKFKFVPRNGVEYTIWSSGKEWRTGHKPPGDCD